MCVCVCVCVHQTVLKNQVADYTREKELSQQAQLDMMEEQRRQEVERKRLATKQVVAFRERVSVCTVCIVCTVCTVCRT